MMMMETVKNRNPKFLPRLIDNGDGRQLRASFSTVNWIIPLSRIVLPQTKNHNNL